MKKNDTCKRIENDLYSFCNFNNGTTFEVERICDDTYVIIWNDPILDRTDFDEIDNLYHITQINMNNDNTLTIELDINEFIFEVPY